MRSEQLLISLLGLLLGFVLIFLGGVLFFIPSLSLQELSQVALHFKIPLIYLPFFPVIVGTLILAACFRLNRRRYLLCKMGGFSVEDRLVAYFIEEKLQQMFPGKKVECDVLIKGKEKVEILANIPYVSEKNRQEIFEKIEVLLSALLRKQCHFQKDFIFNVGFLPPERK